jgi:hypothetical protein
METMNISDMKLALTLKINALDESEHRVLISRLYETLTGKTVSHKNPDNPNEVIILDNSNVL